MGLRSRLRVLFPFLAVALVAVSAHALDSPTYGELRSTYGQIDQAVGAMPSSSLHGSYNRISTLLHSSPVGDLPDGSSEFVPANVERNLVRAIEQLRERMTPAIDALDPPDRLSLLQTTSLAVFEPVQALYSDSTWEFCPEPAAGCDAPAVLSALDRLAQDLIPVIQGLIAAYNDEAAGDPLLPAGPGIRLDEGYNSQSFENAVDEIADAWGLVHGEPIID